MAKIKIDFNASEYQRFKAMDNQVLELVIKLRQIAETTTGLKTIGNLKSYLHNPLVYLENEYWALYSSLYPPMAQKSKVFADNSLVKVGEINHLASTLHNTIAQMHKHKPTITESEVVSGLKESNFDVYLSQAKKPHYNSLVKFKKAIDDLRQFEEVRSSHLIQGTNSLVFDNLDVKINTSLFAE